MNGKRASFRSLAILTCAVLTLASCEDESPSGPTPALVSADAAFAVVVDRPAALLTGTAELWNAAGLEKTYGADLLSFLIRNIPRAEEFAAAVDRGRSIALVYLPVSPGSAELTTLFLIPVEQGQEAVAAELPMGSLRYAGIREGYALFTDGAPGDDDAIDFPPVRPLDLSALSKYPSDSIKLWASPAALTMAAGGGFNGFAEAGRRFVTPTGPEADKGRLLDWGLDILDDLGSSDGAIVVSKGGVTLKTQVRASRGTETERLILLGAEAPGALGWAGQIEANALVGFAWSSTPDFDAAMTGLALSAPGVADSPELAARRALFRDLETSALGSSGSFSLDLGLDQTALASLSQYSSEDEIRQAIDRYFHFDLELLGELKDAKAFIPLLNAILADESIMTAMEKAATDQGLTIDVSSKRRSSQGAPSGQINFNFGIDDARKLGLSGDAQKSIYAAVLDSLSRKLALRWLAQGNRYVVANADWDTVASLAGRGKAKKSIQDDPAFRAFASTFPSRTQYIVSFSTQRLMGLLKSTLSPDAIDPEAFDCWYGYLSATNQAGEGVLELGFFVPSSDIKATIEAITAPEAMPQSSPKGTPPANKGRKS